MMKSIIEMTEKSNANREQQILWYKYMNSFSKQNSIVFAGSTFISKFPINELEQDFQMNEPVYNRGIENLTIKDAINVLDSCVLNLNPNKLFLSLGDVELNSETVSKKSFSTQEFITEYEKIILYIKKILPNCKIYILGIIPIFPQCKEINFHLLHMAAKENCEFLDFNYLLLDATTNTIKENCSNDGKTLLPAGYIAILKEMKFFFRNRMMGFGDIWQMLENWT